MENKKIKNEGGFAEIIDADTGKNIKPKKFFSPNWKETISKPVKKDKKKNG